MRRRELLCARAHLAVVVVVVGGGGGGGGDGGGGVCGVLTTTVSSAHVRRPLPVHSTHTPYMTLDYEISAVEDVRRLLRKESLDMLASATRAPLT